jgi:hypothetical protein
MDIYISTIAILNGHHKWGCTLLAPVLLNLAFTTHAWWRIDSNSEKKWTWLLLLTLTWPQWRACKVIYTLVVQGEERGLKDKEEFYCQIGSLEPYLEAAPQVGTASSAMQPDSQVIIKTAIMGQVVRGTDAFECMINGDDSNTFKISYIISLVGAGAAMVKFLKVGPCHIMTGEVALHGRG